MRTWNDTGRYTVRGGWLVALILLVAGCSSGSYSGGTCGGGYAPAHYPPPCTSHAGSPERHPSEQLAFRHHGTNPQVETRDETTSTFGIDVDDASFNFVKAELAAGRLPEPDAVRVEEFVNHFDYRFPRPREMAVAALADAVRAPFAEDAVLVRFAVQGAEEQPRAGPRRLMFAVDTSGSMREDGRLSQVKYCIQHLVNQLDPDDRVGVVAFSDRASVALPLTPVRQRQEIWSAVNSLRAGGQTHVVLGLDAAFDALGSQSRWGPGRVVLCSDGLANRVSWDDGEMLRRLRSWTERGVQLSTIGFGTTGYNDTHLERLARAGRGRYTYVRSQEDIRREFGPNFARSMTAVAEDVRIQVAFDPQVVRTWRLLGYESRHIENRNFESAWESGANLPAGRSVTALYEVRLQPEARGEIGAMRVSYRDGGGRGTVRVESAGVLVRNVHAHMDAAPPDLRLAACAAELAELLRGSYYARGGTVEAVARVLQRDSLLRSDQGAREIQTMVSRIRYARSRSSS